MLVSQHRPFFAVRQALGSHQPILYSFSTLHVTTMLKLEASGNPAAAALALKPAIEAAGGRVVYTGQAVEALVVSEQLSKGLQASLEIVLITTWRGEAAFCSFRGEHLAPEIWRSMSTGMWRNPIVNALLPLGLGVLRLTSVVTGAHDLSTPQLDSDIGDGDKFDRMMALASKLEAQGAPEDPFYVVNWLKGGTAEQRASDARYGLKMMEMLSQNGGGVMDFGSAISIEGESGEFENVAAVYYPGRAFFVQMIRSTWMHETVKGKQLGDSLAVLTVPLSG